MSDKWVDEVNKALDYLEKSKELAKIGWVGSFDITEYGNKRKTGCNHYEPVEIEPIKIRCPSPVDFPMDIEGELLSIKIDYMIYIKNLILSEIKTNKLKFVPCFQYIEDFGDDLSTSPARFIKIAGEWVRK